MRLALILVTMIACCVTSPAQLHLKTGDVFVYQFTTLPWFDNRSSPAIGGQFYTYGNIQQGGQLQYEMFENAVAGPVLCLRTSEFQFDNGYIGDCQSDRAWQDLQGTIRLTMLQGTADISRLNLSAQRLSAYYQADANFPAVPTYTLAISNNGPGSVNAPGNI